MKNEPVNLASLVNAAVSATVGAIIYATSMSAEATAIVLAVSGAWTAIINWYIARRVVVPTAVVDQVTENRGDLPVSNAEYKEARKDA